MGRAQSGVVAWRPDLVGLAWGHATPKADVDADLHLARARREFTVISNCPWSTTSYVVSAMKRVCLSVATWPAQYCDVRHVELVKWEFSYKKDWECIGNVNVR